MPEQCGEHEYWMRQTASAPRTVLLRRRAGGGPEEIVLDSNLLPEDSELGQARATAGLAGRIAHALCYKHLSILSWIPSQST